MAVETEHDWCPIPGEHGYEMCLRTGLVRSFRRPGARGHPHILRSWEWQGRTWFRVTGGRALPAEELERRTRGEDHLVAQSERTLSADELQEISREEGLKPAMQVAREWNLTSQRVREIWDEEDWDK